MPMAGSCMYVLRQITVISGTKFAWRFHQNPPNHQIIAIRIYICMYIYIYIYIYI